MINFPAAIAAVFPSWTPLNNAILLTPHDDLAIATVVSQLITIYSGAGVNSWALWIRSKITDLYASDTGCEVSGLQRDTTTLMMQATLHSQLRQHEGVVPTSIGAATRATDEPIRSADLEPPDDAPGLTGWVILHDDVAVAGAWSFINQRECGLYAIGTQPEWRRRGIGRALTEHVLAAAWRRGARVASLQATRMGQPLYASLGFLPVGRYDEWMYNDAEHHRVHESSILI